MPLVLSPLNHLKHKQEGTKNSIHLLICDEETKVGVFFQGEISIETGIVMGIAKLIAHHTQTECVKQKYMVERITAKLTAPVLRIHHVRPPRRCTCTQDNAFRNSTVLTKGHQ